VIQASEQSRFAVPIPLRADLDAQNGPGRRETIEGWARARRLLASAGEWRTETTVELLASVTAGQTNGEPVQRLLPFEIYTP
jgi:hypothetical protein